ARDREDALVSARDPRRDERAAGMTGEQQRETRGERAPGTERDEQRIDEDARYEVQGDVGGVEERGTDSRDARVDRIARDQDRAIEDAVRLGTEHRERVAPE